MNPPIRYISVEDDPIDAMVFAALMEPYPELVSLGSFQSGNEAIAAAESLAPDLAFLDVELPDANGIDLLRKMRSKVAMAVFITSHSEFAIDGFELSALDYILKPLTEERLQQAVRRINEYWTMKNNSEAYEVEMAADFLTIKEGYALIKVPINDIVYLEAMQDYTKVVTTTRKYLTLSTLGDFLNKLPTAKFVRTHRSYAVAIQRITQLRAQVLHCGMIEIPVGKTYKTALSSLKF